ncbi:hypothetical protein D3C85_1201110 [compost metagenome]
MGAIAELIFAVTDLAQQSLLHLGRLALYPDADSDDPAGQPGVEHGKAQQAALNHRLHVAVDAASLVIHSTEAIVDRLPTELGGLGSLALQGTQVRALQGVILAEHHLHPEFDHVQAIVQQLADAIET